MGNVAWQSQLVPTDLAAMQGEIAWIEKNEFYSRMIHDNALKRSNR